MEPPEPNEQRETREHRRHHSSHHRRCPYCGRARVRRSHRQGGFEIFLLPLCLRRPFHCKDCRRRYHDFSFGRTSKRRLRVSLAGLLVLLVMAWGTWFVIQKLTETRPRPQPPPEQSR